jgi:hypothetical protein
MKLKSLFACTLLFFFVVRAQAGMSQSADSLDAYPNILGFELGTKLIDKKDLKEDFRFKKEVDYHYTGGEKIWLGYKVTDLDVKTVKGKIVSVTLGFDANTNVVHTLEQLYGKGTGSETAKEWNGKRIGVSFLQVISLKKIDGKMKMIPSNISVCYYNIAAINY